MNFLSDVFEALKYAAEAFSIQFEFLRHMRRGGCPDDQSF